MALEGVIAALATAGIFAVYLPFLLIFSLLFALFTKTKIFGEQARINVLLSVIMSFYIVAFSPVSGTIGLWFATLFAATGVTLVSILVFFLVVGMMVAPFWKDNIKGAEAVKWLVPLGIIVAFLIVMGSSFGNVLSDVSGVISVPGLTSQDLAFLTLVIVTILIIWWMTRKDATTTPGKWFLAPE